ncbi:LacI family DNA-binding transcriptional regulator [Streptomyces sp. B6B3]|uniref:LacI family DNA-binding transcriptional regulator n=1 Tax=Streptomyces sp. B6B3 TaxID=3153570 RepID=UPI00325E3F1F
MAVSMADIAARAGVSATTVSYALSGKKSVSVEARRRVMQAVQELGYRPHAAARALASRRSRTIALVVPPLGRGLVATQLEFVSAVAEEASQHDHDLLLAVSGDGTENMTRLIQEGVVDGLIVMEVLLEDPRVELLRRQDVPFVLVGRPADTAGLRYVDADTDAMVHRAVRHLVDLGHRDVALVNLPDHLLEIGYAPAVRALNAYRSACATHGLTPWAAGCDTTLDATAACVDLLLSQRPATTALLTNNDDAVAGLISALHATGRGVPDDVSLVAVIGPTRAAQLTRPPVTVIELPTHDLATTATRHLITALNATPTHQPASPPAGILFDPPLTPGHTTTYPPARPERASDDAAG